MHALRTAIRRPPPCASLRLGPLHQPQTSRLVRSLHSTRSTPQASPTQPQPSATPSLLPPLNISKWASENAHLLQPPINNYCVHSSPLTVMIVGGPNARTEYHINSTPEFFYQHKGRMLLKTIEPATGKRSDVYIGEGEMFLLPGGVPHNPVRFGGTVGVVVEQPRPEGEEDRLRWYCAECEGVVEEVGFVATDLGSQIKNAVKSFEKDEGRRTCKQCGTRCEVRPSEEEMERMRTGPH